MFRTRLPNARLRFNFIRHRPSCARVRHYGKYVVSYWRRLIFFFVFQIISHNTGPRLEKYIFFFLNTFSFFGKSFEFPKFFHSIFSPYASYTMRLLKRADPRYILINLIDISRAINVNVTHFRRSSDGVVLLFKNNSFTQCLHFKRIIFFFFFCGKSKKYVNSGNIKNTVQRI